jgi:hypothetical protein
MRSLEGERREPEVRRARNVALAVIAICVLVAMVDLLGSTTIVSANLDGSGPRTVHCGSSAFPKALIDFQDGGDPVTDAANCAGQTSAEVALYAVLLAGVALAVAVFTSRGTGRPDGGRTSEPAAEVSAATGRSGRGRGG